MIIFFEKVCLKRKPPHEGQNTFGMRNEKRIPPRKNNLMNEEPMFNIGQEFRKENENEINYFKNNYPKNDLQTKNNITNHAQFQSKINRFFTN